MRLVYNGQGIMLSELTVLQETRRGGGVASAVEGDFIKTTQRRGNDRSHCDVLLVFQFPLLGILLFVLDNVSLFDCKKSETLIEPGLQSFVLNM